ncbi:MAG: hypothetical protein EXR36_08960, partial [Betaproteobacteria bacterium]|nr:hypothetical protein [Betaproteobacteria bacterium]
MPNPLLVYCLIVPLGLIAGCNADPEGKVDNAKSHLAKGAVKAAQIELRNVLKREPNNAQARYLLGVAFKDAGD